MKMPGFCETRRVKAGNAILHIDDINRKWFISSIFVYYTDENKNILRIEKGFFIKKSKVYRFADIYDLEAYCNSTEEKKKTGSTLFNFLVARSFIDFSLLNFMDRMTAPTIEVSESIQLAVGLQNSNEKWLVISISTTKLKADSLLYRSIINQFQDMWSAFAEMQKIGQRESEEE